MENFFIRWMRSQLGTAKLEEETTSKILLGIFNRIIQFFTMYFPMTPYMRVQLQKIRGVNIGKNVFIGLDVYIDPVHPELVTIGNNVSLAGKNLLLTHSDPTLPIRNEKLIDPIVAPIIIEDGAWVTVGVIILPGVRIGKNSIVAAGAVVTKDVLPYTLVGGVPAKMIRKLGPNANN